MGCNLHVKYEVKETLKEGDQAVMVSCVIAEQYKGRVWDVISDPYILLDTVEVVTLKNYKGNSFGAFPVDYLKNVNK